MARRPTPEEIKRDLIENHPIHTEEDLRELKRENLRLVREFKKWRRGAVVGFVILLLGIGGGTYVNEQRSGREQANQVAHVLKTQREADISACRQRNVSRSNVILDSQQAEDSAKERYRVSRTEPILYCAPTIDTGEPVPLAVDEQIKYVQHVAHARLPIVHLGKVVGDRAFPAVPGLKQGVGIRIKNP